MNLFDDPNIEESLLRSCLIFNNKSVKEKKSKLFPKFILSLIIGKNKFSKNDIYTYIIDNKKWLGVSKERIDSALTELQKENFIEIESEGNIEVTQETLNKSKILIENELKRQQELTDDIFNILTENFHRTIDNKDQVKANIKSCISYYYTVCGHSLFDLDIKKEFRSLNLHDIAIFKISQLNKEELAEQIIFSTGYVFEKPNKIQKETIEDLAKIYITTQIMNIDPLLANFKASLIKNKVFILDTDVVLYAITDNAKYSCLYKKMIAYLTSLGCKMYLPDEVVKEVYNHGEAARKHYCFVSPYFNFGDETFIENNIKNIFVEDFFYSIKSNEKLTWNDYIGNYHSTDYDYKFVKSQIKYRLGDKIQYNLPSLNININTNEQSELESKTLELTNTTEKASHREEEKNEDIAKTDTMLYLYIKEMNKIENERNGEKERNDLLMNRYYVLTNSTRVHYAAQNLNLEANVLCKPATLIAYLEEAGIGGELSITSFFNNPFLIYSAETLWDNIKDFYKLGINVKGKNIVTMRYELQNDLNKFLTSTSEEKYDELYQDVVKKGYTFDEKIAKTFKENESLHKKDTENQLLIENLKKQLAEKDKQIKKQQYLDRVHNGRSYKSKGKNN